MTEGFCLTKGNVIILFDKKFYFAHPNLIFHFLLLRHFAFVRNINCSKEVHFKDCINRSFENS